MFHSARRPRVTRACALLAWSHVMSSFDVRKPSSCESSWEHGSMGGSSVRLDLKSFICEVVPYTKQSVLCPHSVKCGRTLPTTSVAQQKLASLSISHLLALSTTFLSSPFCYLFLFVVFLFALSCLPPVFCLRGAFSTPAPPTLILFFQHLALKERR